MDIFLEGEVNYHGSMVTRNSASALPEALTRLLIFFRINHTSYNETPPNERNVMNIQKIKNSIKNQILPAAAVGCIVVTAGVAYYYGKKNLLEINDWAMQELRDGKYLVMKMENGKILANTFSE